MADTLQAVFSRYIDRFGNRYGLNDFELMDLMAGWLKMIAAVPRSSERAVEDEPAQSPVPDPVKVVPVLPAPCVSAVHRTHMKMLGRKLWVCPGHG